MTTIDELMEDPKTRRDVCIAMRLGAIKIEQKYGNMLAWIREQGNNVSMEDCNTEIARREYIHFRYTRRYGKKDE